MTADEADREDRATFEAWIGGDSEAGHRLVAAHVDAVTRFFSTKAREDAEELTQRTFLRVFEGRDRYVARASFRAFVFGVARNILLEHYRTTRRDTHVDFADISVARLSTRPSGRVARSDQRARVVAAMQNLCVDHQIVLELHYWESMSVEDIAEATEVAPGTVKSRLYRARDALSDSLGDLEPSDVEVAR